MQINLTDDVSVMTVQVPTGPQVFTVAVPGIQGIPGPANTLTIGTVNSGASAAASITGASPNQVLNLTIPTSSVSSANITDATTVGRNVLTAVDAAAARTAIGAGTPAVDASTTVKGIIQLTNHLGGTATAPTVRTSTSAQTGIVQLATTTEATTGTDTAKAITAAGLKAVADTKASLVHTHSISDLTATGTKDTTTFLRGDGTWAVPPVSAGAPDATTTTKGIVQLAGHLGGTAAAPTVTSGAGHTHTSSQISDAASAATASMIIKRDASGNAQVATPLVSADISTKGYADALRRPVINQQAAGYTLVLGDERKVLYMTSATAATVTIPTNATVAFPVGTVIDVVQGGAGIITVAGAGVTFWAPDTNLTTRGRWSFLRLTKTFTDTWAVFGDNNNAVAQAVTAATDVATVSTIIKRDAAGRAQVVDPSAAADIGTKNYIDTQDTSFRRIPMKAIATTYTLVLADEGQRLRATTASTGTTTVTLPSDATVALPIGSWVEFSTYMTGTNFSFVAGAGAQVFTPTGYKTTMNKTDAIVRAHKTAANYWTLSGDLDSNYNNTLVLATGASVPAGTPSGTVILRT